MYNEQDLNSIFTYLSKSVEVLLTLEGKKPIMRMMARPDELRKIKEFCTLNNLFCKEADFKIVPEFENDKGFSNKGMKVSVNSAVEGESILYISKVEELADNAKVAEAHDDHLEFGRLLGYPACCTTFFKDNSHIEEKKKNDYVLASLKNSESTAYPFHNNVAARYFDISILSHFPHSFDCEFSSDLGREYLNTVARHSPQLAGYIKSFLTGIFLFTDNEGVHKLIGARKEDGIITYKGVFSTINNDVHEMLESGNLIRNKVLYNEKRFISDIGSSRKLLLFGDIDN